MILIDWIAVFILSWVFTSMYEIDYLQCFSVLLYISWIKNLPRKSKIYRHHLDSTHRKKQSVVPLLVLDSLIPSTILIVMGIVRFMFFVVV